jgi:hypothetical protein
LAGWGFGTQWNDTLIGTLQRAENKITFYCSIFGTTMYFFGSILFIPDLDKIVFGTIAFIIGSLFTLFSQSWKLWRVIRMEGFAFNLSNLLEDLPGTFVELFSGLGSLAYLVGSIIFLPQYDTSDTATYIAAMWFELGALLFVFSGIAIAVKLYSSRETYPQWRLLFNIHYLYYLFTSSSTNGTISLT